MAKQAGYKEDIISSEPILGSNPVLAGLVAEPREFKSGSVGFRASDRMTVKSSNGKSYKYMVTLQLVAISSKDWPEARPKKKTDKPSADQV